MSVDPDSVSFLWKYIDNYSVITGNEYWILPFHYFIWSATIKSHHNIVVEVYGGNYNNLKINLKFTKVLNWFLIPWY